MCLCTTVTCTCFLCTTVTDLSVYVLQLPVRVRSLCTTVTGLYVYVQQLHVPRRFEVKCLGHFIDMTFHR